MRTKKSKWYECKIRYNQTQEDGVIKKVSEQYVVEAVSFSDAEGLITEELKSYTSGEFEVSGIKPTPYREIMFDDEVKSGNFYRCKINFITIDEGTGKEKKSKVNYLIKSESLDQAILNIDKALDGTMIDFSKSTITETSIVDVLEGNVRRKQEVMIYNYVTEPNLFPEE